MKPLGDAFIALIKMMIAPIIFCTVVHGIASIGDLKKVGRVGLKALIYFEVVSTLALADRRGRRRSGHSRAPASTPTREARRRKVAGYASRRRTRSTVEHILAHHPQSFFDAFADGDLLQVLLISILTGVALTGLGEKGRARRARRSTRRAGLLPDHRASIVKRGADRRLRRHGLHHRRVRHRQALATSPGCRHLLRHRSRCSCSSCSAPSPGSPASRSSASSPTSRTSC